MVIITRLISSETIKNLVRRRKKPREHVFLLLVTLHLLRIPLVPNKLLSLLEQVPQRLGNDIPCLRHPLLPQLKSGL